jgi:magnesium-protoporphyrin O-methyltransferase
MSCCIPETIGQQFDSKRARHDLRRFRRRGPIRSTSLLIDELLATGVDGASVLDIGGGIGAIHHALLDAGATSAVHVDLSAEYIAAARDESARRGHADRVRFVQGDFVAVSADLTDADVVTLDRVICCYPDMDVLVARAAGNARRLVGAVYPRDVWWMRLAVTLVNVVCRVRRTTFRVFVHPPALIDEALRQHGFERRALRRTFVWEAVTYRRVDPRAP